MALALTTVYDQNTRLRDNLGDLTIAIFDITGTTADTYPGAAGDPVDFSAVFRQVHHVAFGIFSSLAGGGAWPIEIFVPQYGPTAVAAGVIRFFEQDGAVGPLVNLANAVYPFDFRIRAAVFGRPITDAS